MGAGRKVTFAVVGKAPWVEIPLAKGVAVLAVITALLQRLGAVLMTALHADLGQCLRASIHLLTKKRHVLNQVAVSSMLKNVLPSQNLIVNFDL